MTRLEEPLSNFLVEYRTLNTNGQYKPVAVGKYGIRSRESVYSKELAKDYSKNKLISKDTLTIGMGTNQIDIGVLTDEATFSVSPAYHTYRIQGIYSKYLDYCLRYRNPEMFARYVKRGCRQGKSIDLKEWLKYKIPVYNRNYQEFICETLDKVLDLRNKCGDLLLQMEDLTKSQFIEMFGDYKTNNKKWPIVKLSEISNFYNGLTYSPDSIDLNGCIVLRSSNIQNGSLDLNDIVRVNCNINKKYFVNDGDILMCSRNGSAKLVGKVAVIKNIKEPMCFGAFMMIIKSKYANYLKTYFETEYFKKQINSGISTTTINQITNAMLSKVSLPLPDEELLNKFDLFVSQIDKSKFRLKQLQEKLDTLYKSLLQKYFG